MHFIKFITVSAVFSNYRSSRADVVYAADNKEANTARTRERELGVWGWIEGVQSAASDRPAAAATPAAPCAHSANRPTTHPLTRLRFGKENSRAPPPSPG